MRFFRIWPALLALNVIACGGGGGSSTSTPAPLPPPPTPSALSGQLKFGNTSGLAYTTPTFEGTTDSSGAFSYAAGETVEFRIGAVVVGSAPGQAVLTPADLVAGGSADTEEVQNIARFLMMLDQNDDPSDGIVISDIVQQAAQNWSPVDFSTNDLDNELVVIVSEVASVDARPAALPSLLEARIQIVNNAYCAMSGFFFGRITGDREDVFVLELDPANGKITAYPSDAPANFESINAVSVDSMRTFVAPAANGSGDSIEGRFDSYDEVSGVWTFGNATGLFTASRRLPDAAATFRFTGRFYRVTAGVLLTGPLVINVDDQGSLTVDSHDVKLSRDFQATGTYINNEFSYDYGDGRVHTGTTDAALYVAGSGTQAGGAARPWFAQGCRLN